MPRVPSPCWKALAWQLNEASRACGALVAASMHVTPAVFNFKGLASFLKCAKKFISAFPKKQNSEMDNVLVSYTQRSMI